MPATARYRVGPPGLTVAQLPHRPLRSVGPVQVGIGASRGPSSAAPPRIRLLQALEGPRGVRLQALDKRRAKAVQVEEPGGLAEEADDFAPDNDGSAASALLAPEGAEPGGVPPAAGWALLIMCLSYLHHSTTGFALPSFMPAISKDLHLADTQTALLSLGYTALYALALVPIGLLADRWDRINLLTISISIWSCLIMAASHAQSFQDLLVIRLLFAAAQAAQNPVCFSLIPELFPKNRSSAMALYNSAIYLGRALSFAALFAVSDTAVPGITGVTHINVEDFDPTRWSLLYTTGDSAAVTPLFNYNFAVDYGVEAAAELWRSTLLYLGPPGLLLAWIMSITVPDPRHPAKVNLLASSRFFLQGPPSDAPAWLEEPDEAEPTPRAPWPRSPGSPAFRQGAVAALQGTGEAEVSVAAKESKPNGGEEGGSHQRSFFERLGSGAFVSVTAAATVNDLASWSLVAWQAQFYDRVYDIGPEVYAPLLACVIPVGGIIGGVGGGLVADRLGTGWGRTWLTSAANIAAAPVLALSILADDYQTSLMYLTVGFALSEAWRAPSAVMVREIADESLGATSSAINLCIRNLLGGLGPLGVAVLADRLDGDLQHALLAIPACYAVSGVLFFLAQGVVISSRAPAGGEALEGEGQGLQNKLQHKRLRNSALLVVSVVAVFAALGSIPVFPAE